MPTRWRSLMRLAPGAFTTVPSTTILPCWTGSSPLRQRSSVLLPDPLRPMIATISPLLTSKVTPFSTSSGPKLLRTSRSSMSDMEPPLETLARARHREADRKIERRDRQIDLQRREGRVVEDLASARQLDEADRRGERGILHELHAEADGRWDADTQRLRHDHPAQLLGEGEAERRRRLP